VVIGASTGGPAALNALLKGLPADFPLPIAVVQHVSIGFVPSLVSWLQQASALPLEVAAEGARLRLGVVYFAPDTRHLVLRTRGVLGLSDEPPVSYARPSATVLFSSAAQTYKGELVGVLLTGMGEDGARGLLEIRRSGGVTLAQDEATSVVYGMPAVAAALGAVERLLPLERIAAALVELARAAPG
jgi:two-component system, chemotaxis family, protein-glutamate methylesterase/glutaminase